jgi:hypothetical protein
MTIKSKTSSNWETFVQMVAEDINAGLIAEQLSTKHGETEVCWIGNLRDRKFDEYVVGVQIDMPQIVARLKDGRSLVADYVFLNIRKKDIHLWQGIPKGEQVSFQARIKKAGGIFPSVGFDAFPNNPKIVLTLGLEEAVLHSANGAG